MSKNVLLISALIITLFLILSATGGVGAANLDPKALAVVQSQARQPQPGGGNWVRRPTRPGEAAFVAGEVLVKFKDRARAEAVAKGQKNSNGVLALPNDRALDAILRKHGVTDARQFFSRAKSDSLRRVVKLTSKNLKNNPRGTQELVKALRKDPGVEYAEPNYLMQTQWTPNDPYYVSTGAWGQSFRDLWGLEKINAEAAWDLTRGANVVVAITDTGLDYGHEDIAANVWQNAGEIGTDGQGRDKKTNRVDDDANGYIDDWRGWDFVTFDGTPGDNDPMDDHGHGTHVAGTVAAIGNNSVGIVGVAPESKVMALKGLDTYGSGSVEDLSQAIVYAVDNGAQVINASWGGFAPEPIQTLADAVTYAQQKDVVFVAAAGNNSDDVGTPPYGYFPANTEGAITVSAFNYNDERAWFSNYGAKIDVAAPGGGDTDSSGTVSEPMRSILSLASSQGTALNGGGSLLVGSRYVRQAGTSMAAPHVAGVAALVRSLHPEFSAEQVRQALRAGSDDTGAQGFDDQSGYGRLNAAKTLGINSPLSVQLSSPTGRLTGVEQVNVSGTVAGAGLADWRLEYRRMDGAPAWTLINSSSAPVSNSTLATWNIAAVGDGSFELRVVATNTAGQTFQDRLPVLVDNVLITDPPTDRTMIYRPSPALPIRGTVTPTNLSSYTITVRRTNEAFLANPNITLAGGGTQAVRDGLLAAWDTTDVPAGSYDITLNVLLTNDVNIRKTVNVVIEPAIHEGSPTQLPLMREGFVTYAFADHLVAADVNGDGGDDIVVGYGDSVGVYDHAGRALPGWPQSIDPDGIGRHVQQSPAIGDIDGDGSPEIVAKAGDYLFVWRADGTPLAGWPKLIGDSSATYLSVADINGDGVNEIVMMSKSNLQVVDKRGALLPGWPADLWLYGSSITLVDFLICDLDADGQKEIVVRVDNNGSATELYVFGVGGKVKAGWPQKVDSLPVWMSNPHPAAGDLDGDGDLEIVVTAFDGRVHAYHHNGAVVAGWPQQTMNVVANSPAVGDLDGDGKAEVIVGNYPVIEGYNSYNYLYAWRGNGTLLPGWPVKREGPFNFTHYGFGPPVLVDVDGDGAVDIVASGDHASNHEVLCAYHLDASPVAGFPKHAMTPGAFYTTSPAVADLDGDGLLELAWVDFDNLLYIWDLPSARTAPAPWPMYRHDAALTGTTYSANFKVRPSLQLSSSIYSADEGTSGVQFTVTRTGDSSRAVSVSYATSDAIATAGADYTATSGTVTFAAGDTTAKTITVPVTNDALDELDEPFKLTLSAPTGGAALGAQSSATMTITDDDATPSLAVGDVSVTESTGGTTSVTFNVTLSAASGRTVTVKSATANSTALAPTDYAALPLAQLTFAAGETSKPVTVQINGDAADEANETFKLLLSTPVNALISDGEAICTINDNDLAPSLSVSSPTITEANTTTVANFTVSLSAASGQTVTVKYQTVDGTAKAPADYAPAALTTLTFTPGQTVKTIPVQIKGDLLDEVNETFKLALSSPSNATLAASQGTCTINDNDLPPSVRVANVAVTEGNAPVAANFVVSLSAPSGQAVTAKYATANGTAIAPADYTAKALSTLTFLPGETKKTVAVYVSGDLRDEPSENFKLLLSSPVNATLATTTATCTITDNDPPPSLTITNATVTEPDSGAVVATFTIRLNAVSGQTVTVKYATGGGTSAAGTDYTAVPLTTLSFLPGQTLKTVTVQVKGDLIKEVNETFFVNLSGMVNAAVADGQGLGTIVNDD